MRPEPSDATDAAAPLVAALAENPGDQALRSRAARALADGGRWPEAVATLDGLRNLTAHDPGSLPCLCRRCLPREGGRPEAEIGRMQMRVELAVAMGRVLYFWMPVSLEAERRRIVRSVEADLAQRLGR